MGATAMTAITTASRSQRWLIIIRCHKRVNSRNVSFVFQLRDTAGPFKLERQLGKNNGDSKNDMTTYYVIEVAVVINDLFCQVKLLGGVQGGDKGLYPFKVTVIDGDLPISTDDCGRYRFN